MSRQTASFRPAAPICASNPGSSSKAVIARASHAAGDLSAADSLHAAATALRRRVLGERHVDLAVSLQGWAELMAEQGRTVEAEELYVEALAIRRAALPEGHPAIAESQTGLGRLMANTGRTAEAQALLREALAVRERVFGAEHAKTVEVRSALAGLGETG